MLGSSESERAVCAEAAKSRLTMAANFWTSSHFQQWLFDAQELALLRAADTDALGGEEQLARAMIVYASITQCLGEYLKVRQQVIATACTYFKRFYLMYGFSAADPLLVIPTAVYLAGKSEEIGLLSNSRLIHGMQSHVRLKFPYAFNKPEYPYNMKHIQECEFYLIEIMDCCLIVFQPYRPLTEFMEKIKENGMGSGNSSSSIAVIPTDKCKILFDDAWRFINDSLKTDLTLIHPPSYIALSCLHLASISRKIDLTQWFAELAFDLDILQEIDYIIMNMYETWQAFERVDFPLVLDRMPKAKLTAAESAPAVSVNQLSSSSSVSALSSALVSGVSGGVMGNSSSQLQASLSSHNLASAANNNNNALATSMAAQQQNNDKGLTAFIGAVRAANGQPNMQQKGKEAKRARYF